MFSPSVKGEQVHARRPRFLCAPWEVCSCCEVSPETNTHAHTHIFPNTHTTHRHTYGGGMSTKYCHQSFLACLSPTFFFTNNHYDEFRASLWAKRRKRIRREEKLNCFLWPQDPNWALEHYRATYVLDHMLSLTHKNFRLQCRKWWSRLLIIPLISQWTCCRTDVITGRNNRLWVGTFPPCESECVCVCHRS